MTTVDLKNIKSKKFDFGPRRGNYYEVSDIISSGLLFGDDEIKLFEKMDLVYRTLCGVMYNFVPTSGHPGGSISSGRIIQSVIYKIADYDIKKPQLLFNNIADTIEVKMNATYLPFKKK